MRQNAIFKTAVILAFLSVAILLSRLHTYDEPLERDTASYSVIAHELLLGRSLYSDLWDHKPPAIHVTYAAAQLLAGYGPGSIYLLSVTAAVLVLFGIYAAASTGGRAAGLWAAAFWTVISGDMLLEANLPNTEIFINACLVWAFAVLLRADKHGFGWKQTLIVGSLFALSSLYKQITVIPAVLMVGAHIAFPPANVNGRKQALYQGLGMGLIGMAAWGLTLLYFYLQGRFTDFWEALFIFNQSYSGGLVRNLVLGFSPDMLAPLFLRNILPLFAVMVLGLGLSCRKPLSRPGLLLAVYVASAPLMIALPGRFYFHYYQLWLPVISIAAAWSIAALTERYREKDLQVEFYAGTAILLILVLMQVPSYHRPKEIWSKAIHGETYILEKQLAAKVDSVLLPEETFHVMGGAGPLYFYTRRSPVSGLFTYLPVKSGPLISKSIDKIKEDLSAGFPELLIVRSWEKKNKKLFEWFVSFYQPFPDQSGFYPHEFYFLRGGALASRILSREGGEVRGANP